MQMNKQLNEYVKKEIHHLANYQSSIHGFNQQEKLQIEYIKGRIEALESLLSEITEIV